MSLKWRKGEWAVWLKTVEFQSSAEAQDAVKSKEIWKKALSKNTLEGVKVGLSVEFRSHRRLCVYYAYWGGERDIQNTMLGHRGGGSGFCPVAFGL